MVLTQPSLKSYPSLLFTTSFPSTSMKVLKAVAIVGAGVSGLLSFGTVAYADEAEPGSECPVYPWPYLGILNSNDNSSIRHGQKVFQSDCSSCHSTSLVSYREMAGVSYTKGKTIAMSAEIDVANGLNSHISQLHLNEKAARFANGGAYYTPDLSLITNIREGLCYNPYLPGGAISMPKMLKNGPLKSEV